MDIPDAILSVVADPVTLLAVLAILWLLGSTVREWKKRSRWNQAEHRRHLLTDRMVHYRDRANRRTDKTALKKAS